MGGTFNPAHEGHGIVAETAVKRLALDRLWWVVTPGNPLKSNSDLPSQQERMESCKTFARGPRMVVTGFEAALMPEPGAAHRTHFTADTLGYLRHRLPDVDFVWVMGADNLAGFHKWERWRDIADTMPIAVVDRPGWRFKSLASPAARTLAASRVAEARSELLALQPPPAWTFLTTRLSGASSTALRASKK